MIYGWWREEIAKVLDTDRYTLEWLDWMIEAGRAIAFGDEKGLIVFEMRVYPTAAKDLHFLVAAGNLEHIVAELRPQAESYARANGCLATVVESREGWKRVLEPYGYRLFQTMMRKECDGPEQQQN